MLLPNTMPQTGGRWDPRGTHATLCSVLTRIAIPMEYGLPIVDVIRAMATDPDLTRSAVQQARWRERLMLLAGDLEEGRSFAYALERHLGQFLPPYFLPALSEAEAKGQLATVLPLLIRSLSGAPTAMRTLQGALTYPLIQLFMIGSVLSGLILFIVPKFLVLLHEMAPGYQGSHMVWLLHTIALVKALLPFLPLLPALLLLGFVLRFVPSARQAIQDLFFGVPLFGRIPARTGLIEAASAMSAFLAAGMNMLEAARCAKSKVQRRWARQKLDRFLADLEAGKAWQQAWNTTGFSTPLTSWILENAAAREQPREGFQTVADWALEDLNRRLGSLATFLEPVFLIANGLLVGSVVYGVAGTLFDILYATLTF